MFRNPELAASNKREEASRGFQEAEQTMAKLPVFKVKNNSGGQGKVLLLLRCTITQARTNFGFYFFERPGALWC